MTIEIPITGCSRTGAVELSSVSSGVSYISGAESWVISKVPAEKVITKTYQIWQRSIFPIECHSQSRLDGLLNQKEGGM